MSRAKAVAAIMWWRHGPGGRGRVIGRAFAHGRHAEYHEHIGRFAGCDERCEKILAEPRS